MSTRPSLVGSLTDGPNGEINSFGAHVFTFAFSAVSDRIFSTSVDLTYSYSLPALSFGAIEKLEVVDVEAQFNRVASSAKEVTLEVFATDESASVQVCARCSDISAQNPRCRISARSKQYKRI